MELKVEGELLSVKANKAITHDWAGYVLAALIISGFFTLTAILMWKPLPQGTTEAVFILFGALAGGFGLVCNYFFGSSKSSADKNKLLATKG